jgi:hypothetical protein
VEECGTPRQVTDENIIWRMRFVCWITKATDIHSEYIIIIAFSTATMVSERASVLRYTYIASVVNAYVQHEGY